MKKLIVASLVLLWGCDGDKPAPPATENRQAEPAVEVAAPAPKPPQVTADTAVTSENYEQVMDAQAREYEALEYKPVTLTGFACGDNCYVEYQPHIEGGGDMTAICTAAICNDWERVGKLPAKFVNKKALVKFSTAPQVDGSGKVMNPRFRAIADLKIP